MQTSAQQCPQQAESRVHRQPESGIIHLHHNHNIIYLDWNIGAHVNLDMTSLEW